MSGLNIILAKEFEGELWVKASDLDKKIKHAVADEREACARVCEEIERKAINQPPMVGQGCQACTIAIRARGQE